MNRCNLKTWQNHVLFFKNRVNLTIIFLSFERPCKKCDVDLKKIPIEFKVEDYLPAMLLTQLISEWIRKRIQKTKVISVFCGINKHFITVYRYR